VLDELPRIDARVTLKEALAELVGARAERVLVVEGDRPLGTFGFDALVRALGDGSAEDLDCAEPVEGSDA